MKTRDVDGQFAMGSIKMVTRLYRRWLRADARADLLSAKEADGSTGTLGKADRTGDSPGAKPGASRKKDGAAHREVITKIDRVTERLDASCKKMSILTHTIDAMEGVA